MGKMPLLSMFLASPAWHPYSPEKRDFSPNLGKGAKGANFLWHPLQRPSTIGQSYFFGARFKTHNIKWEPSGASNLDGGTPL
jgi:hypothetical protein